MTWQITLNHVCTILYDISLLAQAYRCMQMQLQTLLFKSAAWHGTFDMIISHLSDLTSPSSDWRCQRRWEMMATLNERGEKQTTVWKRCSWWDVGEGGGVFTFSTPLTRDASHSRGFLSAGGVGGVGWKCGCPFLAVQLIINRSLLLS